MEIKACAAIVSSWSTGYSDGEEVRKLTHLEIEISVPDEWREEIMEKVRTLNLRSRHEWATDIALIVSIEDFKK